MADPNFVPATGLTRRMAMPVESGDPGADKLIAVLSDIGTRVAKLDWYERVALSRRKRAIRAFDAVGRKAANRRWSAGVQQYHQRASRPVLWKRTNLDFINEINAVRFPCRRDPGSTRGSLAVWIGSAPGSSSLRQVATFPNRPEGLPENRIRPACLQAQLSISEPLVRPVPPMAALREPRVSRR
jgi:hypothetical protein